MSMLNGFFQDYSKPLPEGWKWFPVRTKTAMPMSKTPVDKDNRPKGVPSPIPGRPWGTAGLPVQGCKPFAQAEAARNRTISIDQ